MTARNRIPRTVVMLVCLMVALVIAPRLRELSAQDALPSETPTETATLTEAPTLTATLTETPTLAPTDTATLTETPTETATETVISTETPTETETIVATETPTLEGVEATSPTATLIETPTETATSDLFSPSPSPTLTASATQPALPTEPPLTELFTDNFDTGALYLWTLGTGWALVPSEGGQALQVTNSDEPVTFVHNTLTDVAVQAKFLFDSGIARLDVRKSDSGESYNVRLDSTGQVALYRDDALIGSASVTANVQGQWRIIRLSTIGDIVRAAIDGVEVIVVQDSAPLTQGTVSFQTTGSTSLTIDDVSTFIIPSENVLPTEEATNEVSQDISPEQPQAINALALSSYDSVLHDNDAITYISGPYNPGLARYDLGIFSAYANGTTTSLQNVPFNFQTNTLIAGYKFHPKWSPDGSKLAFGCSPAVNQYDICVATMPSGTISTVTVLGVQDNDGPKGPTWSPDGQWIAYFAVRNGVRGIWTRNLNNNPSTEVHIIDATNLQLGQDYTIISTPDWANDNFLYFSVNYQVSLTGLGDEDIKGIYKISFDNGRNGNYSNQTIIKVVSTNDVTSNVPSGGQFWNPYGLILPEVNTSGELVFTANRQFTNTDNMDPVIVVYKSISQTKTYKFVAGNSENAVWSPDGTQLAFVLKGATPASIAIVPDPWGTQVPNPGIIYSFPVNPAPYADIAYGDVALAIDWAKPIFAQSATTIPGIIGLLAQYGIIVKDTGIPDDWAAHAPNYSGTARPWTLPELQEVLVAVQNTAKGLNIHKYSSPIGDNQQAKTLFKNVLAPSNLYLLRVENGFLFTTQPNSDGCSGTTNKSCTNNNFAGIAFYGNLTIKQFTAVHELGHVFDNSSKTNNGLALRDRIANHNIRDCSPDSDPTYVMGSFGGAFDRKERGWGTGPAVKVDGTPLITDFQQDPSNDALEAAADMFLNWVYRLINGGYISDDGCAHSTTPGYWQGPGFINMNWKGQHSNSPMTMTTDPALLDNTMPGDKRFKWMQVEMINMFAEHLLNWQ